MYAIVFKHVLFTWQIESGRKPVFIYSISELASHSPKKKGKKLPKNKKSMKILIFPIIMLATDGVILLWVGIISARRDPPIAFVRGEYRH
jgi:hypothetical protein